MITRRSTGSLFSSASRRSESPPPISVQKLLDLQKAQQQRSKESDDIDEDQEPQIKVPQVRKASDGSIANSWDQSSVEKQIDERNFQPKWREMRKYRWNFQFFNESIIFRPESF